MKAKGFTLIELMVVVVIIGILAAIAIPNFIRMQNRAKESDVKAVAHTFQLAIEDYKTNPGQEGLKPTTWSLAMTYLPTNVQSKKNPFNAAETYANGALMDNQPSDQGRVGYIVTGDQSNPYNIVARGKDVGGTSVLILTLQEGS